MNLEDKIRWAVSEAGRLDGSSAVNGGGLAGAYVGTAIGSEQWLAKADWSNDFRMHAFGATPEDALDALVCKIRDARVTKAESDK